MTNTNNMREAFKDFLDQRNKELAANGHNDQSKFWITNSHYTAWCRGIEWQSQQAQGEVVAYYDPRPGVDWEYRFLEPDVIEQEDNRKFYTVPLIANQPAPAAVPDGWHISRTEGGEIIVQKRGVAGFVASEQSGGIAESTLYYLADDLLTAREK